MKQTFVIIFLIIGINLSADLVMDGMAAHRVGNYEEANKFYTQSCDQGNAKGCLHLGALYSLGHGTDRNIDIANKYFQKSCEAGNKKGCELYKFYSEKH